MKKIYHGLLNFIKNHKIWSIVILLIIIGLVWSLSGSKKTATANFVLAEISTIREEVSVTGNVKPLTDVDLAFERGGKVANINVEVGDKVYTGQVLASISNADLVASLNQAQANLKKVRAGLGDNAIAKSLEFSQAKISLSNSIKDSYTKADDALRNKIYSLFNDPIRYSAKLSFSTDNFLQEDIEDGKDKVSDSLDSWQRLLNKTDINIDLESNYTLAKNNLLLVKDLLDKCATAVNGLSADSYSSQTQIDSWKLNISTARTNINSAIDSLTSDFNNYKTANLSVQISKNDTLAEEASVEQALAGVASAEAELAKTIIKSPINGLVTDIPIKLGEIVPMNQKAISVISGGAYQIESFVPEADISKIKIGNTADTTLDAYSGVNFKTEVIKIDPAATIIDGVPTYKVTLKFVDQDERIRSGMTANLDILTAEKKDALTVVTRAVYTKDGSKFVKVVGADNTTTEVKVETGLKGFDGKIEILSGLTEGDKVSL